MDSFSTILNKHADSIFHTMYGNDPTEIKKQSIRYIQFSFG
jgi:hypothetical protein